MFGLEYVVVVGSFVFSFNFAINFYEIIGMFIKLIRYFFIISFCCPLSIILLYFPTNKAIISVFHFNIDFVTDIDIFTNEKYLSEAKRNSRRKSTWKYFIFAQNVQFNCGARRTNIKNHFRKNKLQNIDSFFLLILNAFCYYYSLCLYLSVEDHRKPTMFWRFIAIKRTLSTETEWWVHS